MTRYIFGRCLALTHCDWYMCFSVKALLDIKKVFTYMMPIKYIYTWVKPAFSSFNSINSTWQIQFWDYRNKNSLVWKWVFLSHQFRNEKLPPLKWNHFIIRKLSDLKQVLKGLVNIVLSINSQLNTVVKQGTQRNKNTPVQK